MQMTPRPPDGIKPHKTRTLAPRSPRCLAPKPTTRGRQSEAPMWRAPLRPKVLLAASTVRCNGLPQSPPKLGLSLGPLCCLARRIMLPPSYVWRAPLAEPPSHCVEGGSGRAPDGPHYKCVRWPLDQHQHRQSHDVQPHGQQDTRRSLWRSSLRQRLADPVYSGLNNMTNCPCGVRWTAHR